MYTNTVYKDSIKKQKFKYLIFPVFPCTLGIIRNLFVDLVIYLNLFSKPSVIFSDILKLFSWYLMKDINTTNVSANS